MEFEPARSTGSSRVAMVAPAQEPWRDLLSLGEASNGPRVAAPYSMPSRKGQIVARTSRPAGRGARAPASRVRAAATQDFSIRERVGIARQAASISRAELSRRVGVRASAAAQWEQQEGTAPSVENLARIAAATGVAFEWLATGRGAMRPGPQDEAPAVILDAFAQILFEERLLRLGRRVAPRKREALLATLDLLLIR
jgi:transcriptional regulator with XRE-family HTH domain